MSKPRRRFCISRRGLFNVSQCLSALIVLWSRNSTSIMPFLSQKTFRVEPDYLNFRDFIGRCAWYYSRDWNLLSGVQCETHVTSTHVTMWSKNAYLILSYIVMLQNRRVEVMRFILYFYVLILITHITGINLYSL